MGQQADQVVALIEYMRGEQENLYASLPNNVRTSDGTWEVWGPKDVLGHFYFWQNNLLKIFNGLDQTPPEEEPFMERNRKNYLDLEHSPYSEVYAAYKKSLDELIARTKTFSDAELSEPQRFARIPNGTLQGTILGNTYSHMVTHLAELVSKYGNAEQGHQLQETATQKLIDFDPSPRTKGVALYNLACASALSGQSARAIELLRETFPLRPDLVEFSKEDTDFNGVRHLPEFQALYN